MPRPAVRFDRTRRECRRAPSLPGRKFRGIPDGTFRRPPMATTPPGLLTYNGREVSDRFGGRPMVQRRGRRREQRCRLPVPAVEDESLETNRLKVQVEGLDQ